MNTAENFRFKSVEFRFSGERVDVELYPDEGANTYALSVCVGCWHLDWADIFCGANMRFASPNVLCGGASQL
jgi:hypothetical protein